MIFETETDLIREKKAIELFVSIFNGSYKKLGQFDIDYKVSDDRGQLIAYVEVKGRIRSMKTAYPLPISAAKLVKLVEKRLNPVIVWACDDGIIYAQVNQLIGEIKWGGRPPREGSYNDSELMVYYDKQKSMKYVRYV
jgi:hypothetical protein